MFIPNILFIAFYKVGVSYQKFTDKATLVPKVILSTACGVLSKTTNLLYLGSIF